MFTWLEKLFYFNCDHDFETILVEQLDYVHIKQFKTDHIEKCTKCGKIKKNTSIQDYNDNGNFDGVR